MKILKFEPNQNIPIHRHCIVRGFTIEPELTTPIDALQDHENSRFEVIVNNQEYIITNLPLMLGDKRFVWTPFQQAMAFKYARPFVLTEGSIVRFAPKSQSNFAGDLLLYVNYISDKELDKYLKEKKKTIDDLEFTRLRCEYPSLTKPTHVINMERPARIISIGFCIGRRDETASPPTEKFLPVRDLEYAAIVSSVMGADIRARLELSGSKYSFWDDVYRSIKLLIGDMQEGNRHILKGIKVDPKIRYDNIQLALEKSIADVNTAKAADSRYTPLNIVVEYVYL